MSINLSSALGIETAAILCALATFLAYDAEMNAAPLGAGLAGTGLPAAEPAWPAIPENKVKEDWDELLGMVMRADLYRKDGLHEEAAREDELARQKIGYVARDYLGADFVSPDGTHFIYKSTVGGGPSASCEPTEGAPAHLAEIRGSEWFRMFAGKYSQYGINMAMIAVPDGGTSYGFFAESGDGMRAITYFQTDPCTGQTAALNERLLACMGDDFGYNFLSSDRGDIAASLGLGEFCFIPVTDPWRQSVYDYADGLTGALMLLGDDMGDAGNYESKGEITREAQRLILLRAVSYMIASDSFEYGTIQKHVQMYCDGFGPLPEDYVALVGPGAQDARLTEC